uniref:Odorant receptor n=1 Tax=Schistocerca gregaria TaxID=7010 RepID=A0A221I0D1_SCHGR|nr:odorant receptor 17 [Schistocerca gregaria]
MEPAADLAEELQLLQWLMHWAGTMRHPRAGPWAGRAYYLLNAIALAAIVLFLCGQGTAILREGTRDLDRFMLMVSTFNSVTIWFLRMCHIAIHEHQFHFLALQMDRDFREFLNLRDIPPLRKRCRGHRRFLLFYLTLGVIVSVVWSVLPMATFGVGPEAIPNAMALPYDVSHLHTFIPTWIFSAFIVVHVTIMTITTDTFNVSLIAQLRFQLFVLNRNLITLNADAETIKSPLTKGNYITNKSSNESLEHRNIHHRLKQNVLHHQLIIRNTELMEKCIGGILLAQCLSIGAAVSLQLFQVAVNSRSLTQAGKCSWYLTLMLAEVFVYCWFGDELITESENVTMSAYTAATSLQGFPADVRKSLLLVMTRAQRPLRITAGGLFPFCRESFVSIVNMSYSYFAILRNFKDD